MNLPPFGGTREEAEKKERPWGAMTSGGRSGPFCGQKEKLGTKLADIKTGNKKCWPTRRAVRAQRRDERSQSTADTVKRRLKGGRMEEFVCRK